MAEQQTKITNAQESIQTPPQKIPASAYFAVVWHALIWIPCSILSVFRRHMIQFLIWSLRPTDLRQLIVGARTEQFKTDKAEFKKTLDYELLQAERSKQIEIAKKEAEIEMLERSLHEWEKREGTLGSREYLVKMQVKENASVALSLFMHVKNIMLFVNKEAAEIAGVVDNIEENKKQIENKLK